MPQESLVPSFCGLRFALVCAIVIVIDLWSGLSVTLSVADAQMIGAIYGVKQTLKWVCFRPQPEEASPLVAGFPFLCASGSVYARRVGGRVISVCRSVLFEGRMGGKRNAVIATVKHVWRE